MAAITNGIALHGGFKPYCATFLVFSEYARNALRMAALMKINPIFVYTHDSIGLGEDGPAGIVDSCRALEAVPSHPGRHNGESGVAEDFRCRRE